MSILRKKNIVLTGEIIKTLVQEGDAEVTVSLHPCQLTIPATLPADVHLGESVRIECDVTFCRITSPLSDSE